MRTNMVLGLSETSSSCTIFSQLFPLVTASSPTLNSAKNASVNAPLKRSFSYVEKVTCGKTPKILTNRGNVIGLRISDEGFSRLRITYHHCFEQ